MITQKQGIPMKLSEQALKSSTTYIANMADIGAKIFSRQIGVKTTSLSKDDIKLIIARGILARLKEKQNNV
jgi:hypothetical protein